MTEFAASTVATPEAISRMVDDLMAFLRRASVDARATHHVALVVEEMLANLGSHGGCRDAPARITVSVEPGRVKGEIVDCGPAFDPRTAPAPDLAAMAEGRQVGGLGLHLVRRLSTLDYCRRDGENRLTFFVARG